MRRISEIVRTVTFVGKKAEPLVRGDEAVECVSNGFRVVRGKARTSERAIMVRSASSGGKESRSGKESYSPEPKSGADWRLKGGPRQGEESQKE